MQSPLSKTIFETHSASVDQLHGFQYLTSIPVDHLLSETRTSALKRETRAKSVITANLEDEVKRRIKGNLARKKLDRVLYNQQQQLKQ